MLDVHVHDSDFKRARYQIQTWAALPGLTNEELLCGKQRNLQHLPFIYTGGPVCICVCICARGGRDVGVCVFKRERACSLFYVCVSESAVHINTRGLMFVCGDVRPRFRQMSHNNNSGNR